MGMVIASVKVAQGERLESVDHDEANHGEKNRHDRQHGNLRDETAAFADLLARHLAERFSVAPNRAKENDKILHAARKRRAGNQPKRARQVAELRGERRADERAGSRDGGKMVPEENPFVGRPKSRPSSWRSLGVARVSRAQAPWRRRTWNKDGKPRDNSR